MRPIDWGALRLLIEQMVKMRDEAASGGRADYRALSGESHEYRIPAIQFVNALGDILSTLARGEPMGIDQHGFAIAALKLLGPQKSVSKAERNQEIQALADKAAHGFFMTKAELQAEAASKFHLSPERIRKLESAAPSALGRFLYGDASKPAIAAGEKALARIRKTLLSRSGKGEAMRSLAVVEFANIGASELQSEIVQDVDALVGAGMSETGAFQSVAEAHGFSRGKVRSTYQRAKQSARDDLNTIRAAEAARRIKA